MKFALFSGCKSAFYLPQYRTSSKLVLSSLGVELKELEFNCCGYPMRAKNLDAFLILAAKNLALAEQQDLPILTLCQCCFGSLKHADHYLKNNPQKKEMIVSLLKEEGLDFKGTTKIEHILTVFANQIGYASIEKQITKKFTGLKIAPHYGCHALRPSNITQFDNPHAPTIFEQVIQLTGATPVDWSKRLECCGNPLWEKNNELSLGILEQKIDSAKEADAHMICSACNYCQLQFDEIQKNALAKTSADQFPSIFISQLLGLSMGFSENDLNINANHIDLAEIKNFL
jgi:heterodisulfide reductase subunit B